MKKTFTKLAGGFMAASMILGTVGVAAPSVFADETPSSTATTYTLTVNNGIANDKGTHVYSAYQVFVGDKVEGNVLSNLKWGSGIAEKTGNDRYATFSTEVTDAIFNVLKDVDIKEQDATDSVFITKDQVNDATIVAKALDAISKLNGGNGDAEKSREFARAIAPALTVAETDTADGKDDTTIANLKPGYYLVKDAATPDANGNNTAVSDYMMEVVGNVTMNAKSDVPTSNKTVADDEQKDINKNNTEKKKDNADYDIGDEVPFELTGTVSNKYSTYKNAYHYAFVDQYCAGLDAPTESSIKVYAVTGTGKEYLISDKTSETNADEKAKGYTIVAAHAITPAPAADAEYQNEWGIDFSDLKKVYGQEMVDGEPSTDSVAVTNISSIRIEYTAKLNKSAKIGSAGNPNKSHIEYSNNPNGDGEGKSDDTHVKVFTYELIVTKHDGQEQELEGAGFTLYKKTGVDETTGDDIWEAVKVDDDGKVDANGHEEVTPALAKTVNGKKAQFDYSGLDEGTYKLVETTVPQGYNKAPDLIFTVTSTQTNTDDNTYGAVTKIETDKGSDIFVNDGTMRTTVINNQGAQLPSTGGIGTTIFYIVGAAAAVTAVVLLTTRRRANKED